MRAILAVSFLFLHLMVLFVNGLQESLLVGVHEGKNHHQKSNTRGRREANKRLLSISDPILFTDIHIVEDCSTLRSCESCIEADQMNDQQQVESCILVVVNGDHEDGAPPHDMTHKCASRSSVEALGDNLIVKFEDNCNDPVIPYEEEDTIILSPGGQDGTTTSLNQEEASTLHTELSETGNWFDRVSPIRGDTNRNTQAPTMADPFPNVADLELRSDPEKKKFLDPITYFIMQDPVLLPGPGNYVMDRQTIEYLKFRNPFTRTTCDEDKIKSVEALKEEIQEWLNSKKSAVAETVEDKNKERDDEDKDDEERKPKRRKK